MKIQLKTKKSYQHLCNINPPKWRLILETLLTDEDEI